MWPVFYKYVYVYKNIATYKCYLYVYSYLLGSVHEKSHINVYLQTRLMIYVLVAVLVSNAQYSVLLKYNTY